MEMLIKGFTKSKLSTKRKNKKIFEWIINVLK